MKELNDCGSSNRPLKRELFETFSSLDLFNTITLLNRQLPTIVTVMNVNAIMVVVPPNVLHIQLLRYHNNDDPVIHITQLTKVFVINGEYIDDHKLQYFSNSLTGRATNWFARYETTHPIATWNEVQWAFISLFSEICNEGQTIATLRYTKQKKYEFVEYYYDKIL